jgi:hypothetical protein
MPTAIAWVSPSCTISFVFQRMKRESPDFVLIVVSRFSKYFENLFWLYKNVWDFDLFYEKG